MKRFLIFLLLLCTAAARLSAAIAYDATASTGASAQSTVSFSHALGTGSGTNRILVLGIASENTTTAEQAISSVTFNGTAMTAVSGGSTSTGLNRVDLYYILDANLPASSGSYTVQVTFAGTVDDIVLGTVSLTGVNQAAREAVQTGTATATTTISTNITTIATNAWLVSCIGLGAGNTLTAGGTATERVERTHNATLSAALSTTSTTTPGATSASWTASASTNRLVHVVASFAPVAVATITLSGNVFEDVTYAGGVGRTKATSSGVNRASARVELFDASGNYVSATTTDASGNYSFTVTQSLNYTIRVVNSTVTSSLGGTSLIPVQTYRTTATTGSAVDVTDRVGGETPSYADAGNGSTTLAALSSGSVTPQSITSVTASTSNITGLNFGFNFNTIVNTADTGQGSLRQFITNANGMSGTQTSVFMISGGSAVSGLRTGLTNQLTSGVAVITLSTALPQITATLTLDGTSQTTNVGNTNSGTLGTGGTVGVDAVALSTVNRPEVEIIGTSAMAIGIDINAASTTVQGIAIHGHGAASNRGDIVVRAASASISACVVGTTATSFSLPGANTTGGTGVVLLANAINGSLTNSLVGFTNYGAIRFDTAPCTGWTISGVEIRGANLGSPSGKALSLQESSQTISGNLIVANKGAGIEITGAMTSLSVINNTITGNGVTSGGSPVTAGVRITASLTSSSFDRNIITANYGAGVLVLNGITGVRLTKNSIYDNGTITNDASAAATGQIGIDLLSAGDSQTVGTAPFYTINDSGDGDSGGNNLLNFPVLDTAVITGSNLVLTGWARSGSIIEFFIADSDASNFGEGQTYVGTVTEGSGSDTDATSSAYSNPVNSLNQGGDTTNRFTYTFTLPGGVSAGTRLTATATDASNNTSEFSGVVTATISTLTLSGNVFEDVTYSGGVGRTKATSSGVNCASARVELFDGSGNYVSATTTDASGDYSFTVDSSANYTIRVVNSTVTSSLGGTSLIPVQTYRTTATTGSAVDVTDRVGGETPSYADAGNGSTTLAALSSGSVTPQSITSVTASTSNITGLNFGFNFNTIVNTADTGQGSLRQFITNANGMSGTQTSVFMITDGSAHSGLRTGLTNQLTSGVAVITLATALPQITATLTLDGTSQTTNVGNTNSGTLGTGGTVGVDAVALSTVNRPEVEIIGTSAMSAGLDINAASTTIQGIAIHGHGASSAQGDIVVSAVSGVSVTACVVGTTASSFTLPGSNSTGGSGIVTGGSSGTLSNNLIGFAGSYNISLQSGSSGCTVSNNEIRGGSRSSSTLGGLNLLGSSHAISGNLIIANQANGIDNTSAVTSTTITNNTVSGNGVSSGSSPQTSGLRLLGTGVTVDRNIITANYGAGVMVTSSGSGVKLTLNSIYANGTITNLGAAAATGQIGIDLLSAGDSQTVGTAPFYTINDSSDTDSGGNTLINMPVIDMAIIVGSNLVISGWVSAGSTVEFFISDGAASGFGEGQTYIGSVTEGSGSDTDATTGSYSGTVNCFAQGADTTVARFSYTFAKPGSVSVGTLLTATATNASNNTSEFSGNTAVVSSFPSYTAVKSSETISDPLNATTNPKAIPGAIAQYSVTVTNSNPAYADLDSFVVTDPIPTNTELFVGDLAGAGTGPVQFVDGATTSALTYTFTSLASTTDDLSFSNDSGSTWTYVPVPDANGCDSTVTNLRINPKGTFAKAACGDTPSCTFHFRVRVK